ncbi:hypothetical protein HK102_002152 [Quaeritorhiza haematococci]|nr:hypothetical protein HK102_002152 [Quaeritorhiza haematococci]
MGSNNDASTPDDLKGVIPRAVEHVFDALKDPEGSGSPSQEDDGSTYIVKISFLEIYQEQVRDLLMPGVEPKEISIREDKNGTINVCGIHEQIVKSPLEALKLVCLAKGVAERTTGDTHMHQHSSRSHAIFTVILEKHIRIQESSADPSTMNFEIPVLERRSKLHLVDLAGSERLKRTGAEGVRFKESVKHTSVSFNKINSGLLALGNVISRLTADAAANAKGVSASAVGSSPIVDRHVPYRNSKLTSPEDDDYDETLNTLQYSQRARKIQNKPSMNTVDPQTLEIVKMQQKIIFLEEKLQKHETAAASVAAAVAEALPLPLPLPSSKPATSQGATTADDLSNGKPISAEDTIRALTAEVKNRTIRLTNTMRALQEAQHHNQRLTALIEDLNNQNEESETTMQTLSNRRDALLRDIEKIEGQYHHLRDEFSHAIICVVRLLLEDGGGAAAKPDGDIESLRSLIVQHVPEIKAQFEEALSKRTRPTSSRNQRAGQPDADEELSEAKELIRQLEDELEETRMKLLNDESIFEEKMRDILQLERQNTRLAMENKDLRNKINVMQSSSSSLQLKRQAEAAEEENESRGRKTNHFDERRPGSQGSQQRGRSTEGMGENEEKQHRSASCGGTAAGRQGSVGRFGPRILSPALLTEQLQAGNRQLSAALLQEEAEGQGNAVPRKVGSSHGSMHEHTGSDDDHYVVYENKSMELASTNLEEEHDDYVHEDSHSEDDRSFEEDEESMRRSRQALLSDGLSRGEESLKQEVQELRRQLAQSGQELNAAVKLKVDAIRDLSKAHKEMERMRQQFQDRISKLDRELESCQREMVKLRDEHSEKDQMKEKMKEDFEKKTKFLESQLGKLKSKQKDADKLVKEKEVLERKMQDCQQELERLNAAQAAMKRKIKEDGDKFAESELRRAKEQASQRKQSEDDTKKIRSLELQVEMLRKKLDRKAEEVATLVKKIKDNAATASVAASSGATMGGVQSGSTGPSKPRSARNRKDESAT